MQLRSPVHLHQVQLLHLGTQQQQQQQRHQVEASRKSTAGGVVSSQACIHFAVCCAALPSKRVLLLLPALQVASCMQGSVPCSSCSAVVLLLLLPQPPLTCRLSSDRLTAASTLAGVGRELKMLGTYFVNTCTGWLPASRHDWLNLPRMPAGGRGGTQQAECSA
jgi:hypothetical protein